MQIDGNTYLLAVTSTTAIIACVEDVHILQHVLLDGTVGDQHGGETLTNLVVVVVPTLIATLPGVTRFNLVVSLTYE